MACISKLGKGKQPPRAIDFVDSTDDRRRKRIRIGVVSHDFAMECKRRVERLLSAKILNQSIDQETAEWLSGVSDDLHDRVARTGLCEPREAEAASPSLSAWCETYLDQRKHELGVDSIRRIRNTVDRLLECFGEDTPIDVISAAACKQWRVDMQGEVAEATVRLHCRNAKGLFNEAVEQELLPKNPFRKLKSSSIASERDRYVTPDETQQLLEACPNGSWRTLIGLARLAGLRVPSETHRLTWRDVDWDRRRLTVYAPKTSKTRQVPIVADLFAILQDQFDAAEEGAECILPMSKHNLNRDFRSIIVNAGLIPWEDLFQTLRRSAETWLALSYPQHAVSAWIGHSVAVSQKYYLQVTDDLFDAAVEGEGVLRAAESAAVNRDTAQKCLVRQSRQEGGPREGSIRKPVTCKDLRHVTGDCKVDRAGIEPATPGFSVGMSSSSGPHLTACQDTTCGIGGQGDKPEAQQKAQHGGPEDHDLRIVMERWRGLSGDQRKRIMRIVEGTL